MSYAQNAGRYVFPEIVQCFLLRQKVLISACTAGVLRSTVLIFFWEEVAAAAAARSDCGSSVSRSSNTFYARCCCYQRTWPERAVVTSSGMRTGDVKDADPGIALHEKGPKQL